jgi:hypothetical protein
MKSALLIAILGLSNIANASPDLINACPAAAVEAAANFAGNGYDADGFYGLDCFFAQNSAAVICSVAASKGNGDATDTYQVVLNKSCTRAYRVELKYEE